MRTIRRIWQRLKAIRRLGKIEECRMQRIALEEYCARINEKYAEDYYAEDEYDRKIDFEAEMDDYDPDFDDENITRSVVWNNNIFDPNYGCHRCDCSDSYNGGDCSCDGGDCGCDCSSL